MLVCQQSVPLNLGRQYFCGKILNLLVKDVKIINNGCWCHFLMGQENIWFLGEKYGNFRVE